MGPAEITAAGALITAIGAAVVALRKQSQAGRSDALDQLGRVVDTLQKDNEQCHEALRHALEAKALASQAAEQSHLTSGKVVSMGRAVKRAQDAAEDVFGSILADEKGLITSANGSAAFLLGYPRAADMIGRPIVDLIPDGLRASHLDAFQMAMNLGNPVKRKIDAVGLRKDGTDIPLNITLRGDRQNGGWLFEAVLRKREEA